MPTYFITWTATVRGHTRVDADNAEKAAQFFLDTDPTLGTDIDVSNIAIDHVEEADPGITWR
jgi:hypothetical protein